MAKKIKQAKPDYIYQCEEKGCNQTKVHRAEPSNEPCPLCEKRMTLIKIVNQPNVTPSDIKYPEEIRTDAQYRTLKLSKLAKLHELKSILSKPVPPDQAA